MNEQMYSCCVFLLLGIQPHYPNKLCQPDAILTSSAMDSDATIDSDGYEKEDSQGKKKEKKKKESQRKVRDPPDFYRGRRGAFPFASLLYSPSTTEEDFLNAEAAKKDKIGQSSNSSSVTKEHSAIDSIVQNFMQCRVSKSIVSLYE